MANPISGPYTYTALPYHASGPGKYNKVVLAAATFYATGSNAYPSAFYVSGSGDATVTLANGGSITVNGSDRSIFEMSVASVTSGTVYLLYS